MFLFLFVSGIATLRYIIAAAGCFCPTAWMNYLRYSRGSWMFLSSSLRSSSSSRFAPVPFGINAINAGYAASSASSAIDDRSDQGSCARS